MVFVMKKIIVGMTGASGQIYGIRLMEMLRQIPDVEIHLIISDWAKKTIALETEWKIECVEALAHQSHNIRNQAAAISSGSFKRYGMVVLPCSIKTLSAIANSYTENLLIRAADVTLKERNPLILAVRETPLHKGHIRLMSHAVDAGAIIAPPVPALYNQPRSIMDIIDNSVYRYLDLLGLEHYGAKRWVGAEIGNESINRKEFVAI
jgi:4-hydroxy-3-polyprenylbenzoate decarboxylase